jgi:hypothetical protein
MRWQGSLFLWWQEISNPPTAEEIQWWKRIHQTGFVRYILACAVQSAFWIWLLSQFIVFLVVGRFMNPAESVKVWLILMLIRLPYLYLTWKTNDRIYLAATQHPELELSN